MWGELLSLLEPSGTLWEVAHTLVPKSLSRPEIVRSPRTSWVSGKPTSLVSELPGIPLSSLAQFSVVSSSSEKGQTSPLLEITKSN